MPERCPVCGQSTIGLTHSCPGPIPAAPDHEAVWTPPSDFAPLFYFRQALAIARLDEAAVVAASKDSVALFYGAIIWIIASLCSFVVPIGTAISQGKAINWLVMVFAICFGLVLAGTLTITQYAVCHLLARWWFGARGTYLGILRPMLMGSIVTCLALIPYIGMTAAALWSIAILMRVFEEVDHIERMQAFMLSFGVGLVFWILALSLTGPKH